MSSREPSQHGTSGYRAILPATLPLVPRATYVAIIEADGGPNRVGRWEFYSKPLARVVKDQAE
jgi:hypothetical protein